MKKFLAIDTSSRYLTVIAFNEKPYITYMENCAMKHSVVLMDAVEETFEKAGMKPCDCDFFAACVGAGSFTGIRIGIACIKGFAVAFGKPTLPVTSFECIAYNAEEEVTAAIDAMHGKYYVCSFDRDKNVVFPPSYVPGEEVVKMNNLYSFEELPFRCKRADMAQGLLNAVLRKSERGEFGELSALYIRKSQAEENLR